MAGSKIRPENEKLDGKIVGVVAKSKEPLSRSQIAAKLKLDADEVGKRLPVLAKKGSLKLQGMGKGAKYAAA